jgi:hypothetical protein
VAYAKANPGKLNYASSGNGSIQHIGAEQLKQIAGIGYCHVWTACLGQGCKFSFGSRQGSVMCPAC